ncbi:MAG: hypothetical protein ACLRLD_04155 [Lachnospira sp.]
MENNWLDNNVELLLLIVNWGVVAIQAFTIFVSGGELDTFYHYAMCCGRTGD